MALTKEQLQEMKSKEKKSGNTVTRIGRVTLSNLLAKYAGRTTQYDEYTNRDSVPFTFYWFDNNMADFQKELSTHKNINAKIAKSFVDSLFKFNNGGERVIYGNRRRPLPELVTYDENSNYSVVVDLLHAQGTGDDGQPFDTYYTKVINVVPTLDSKKQFLVFTEQDVSKMLAGTISDETKMIENQDN